MFKFERHCSEGKQFMSRVYMQGRKGCFMGVAQFSLIIRWPVGAASRDGDGEREQPDSEGQCKSD